MSVGRNGLDWNLGDDSRGLALVWVKREPESAFAGAAAIGNFAGKAASEKFKEILAMGTEGGFRIAIPARAGVFVTSTSLGGQRKNLVVKAQVCMNETN